MAADYVIGGNNSSNKTDRTDMWAKFKLHQGNVQNQKERDCDKIGSFLNGSIAAGAYLA